LAAHLGLPYCFAHFFNDGAGAAEALALYRGSFCPSPQLPAALASLCVWALAAPNAEAADRLFAAYAHWRLDRDRGRVTPFPSPEDIAAHDYGAAVTERIERLRQRTVYGTPDKVAARLRGLAESFGADELVVITMTHDPADRVRSYELIGTAMGLASPAHRRADAMQTIAELPSSHSDHRSTKEIMT
jgi:alkanesulfonate monooxygenase SsuD/methylene tetrahydromethanopterin reductase-like flavin-dependent oxidoreductase (luciferase family)